MTSVAVSSHESDTFKIVEKWLKREQDGEKFPVDFDIAWQLAGYSRKDAAKRKLVKMIENIDFHKDVEVRNRPQGGTVNVEIFTMSCDALKHFCLLAETEQGRNIRQYFIECEKKWKLVEQRHPEVSEEMQRLHMENENLRLQAQISENTLKIRQLDSNMIIMHGAPLVLALRGMTDQVVEVTKVITEVIDERTGARFRGATTKQMADIIKQETGIKFKSGAELERFLEDLKRSDLLAQTPRKILTSYIPEENMSEVVKVVNQNYGYRQLVLGE